MCVCRMFGGSKLAQNTTMLWGDHKKKAVKSNPWVSARHVIGFDRPAVAHETMRASASTEFVAIASICSSG